MQCNDFRHDIEQMSYLIDIGALPSVNAYEMIDALQRTVDKYSSATSQPIGKVADSLPRNTYAMQAHAVLANTLLRCLRCVYLLKKYQNLRCTFYFLSIQYIFMDREDVLRCGSFYNTVLHVPSSALIAQSGT